MTVYVDDMRARFRGMIMCHMIADTEAELHAMAARIGVKRRWYQGVGPGDPAGHYDISLGKRREALLAGAVAITWRQLGCMVANRKATGRLGMPATAESAFHQRVAEERERRQAIAAGHGDVGAAGRG